MLRLLHDWVLRESQLNSLTTSHIMLTNYKEGHAPLCGEIRGTHLHQRLCCVPPSTMQWKIQR
jgi:hypothetical protein